MEKPVLTETKADGIHLITLNRPEKRNALNIALMEELCATLEKVSPGSRAIILMGKGEVFCAGLDLQEAADEKKVERSSSYVAKMLKAVQSLPLVTIAAVHGAATAGGAGLMAACDLVIAAEGTRIGFPEVRRGLVPALVMTLLVQQLGQHHLRELVLLGELINAAKAASMGLVNRIVPPEKLLEEVMQMAELAIKGAPSAIAKTKKLLGKLSQQDFDKALEWHLDARHSQEAKEGIAAFLEKRKPSWHRT